MRNFHKYLEKVYDNEIINFDMIINEKLKNPAEFISLILKRFENQKQEFEDYLPELKDLGLLQADFTQIK